MPSPKPVINGLVYDHSSIEININGARYLVVSEISYSQTLEPGKQRGAAAKVLGRTRGEYDAEGSVKMSKDDGLQLIKALGAGFMTKSFPIVCSYAEAGQEPITDTLEGCRITKTEDSSSGTDALETTFSLHIMNLRLNGIDATGEKGNLGTGVKIT